MLTSLTIDTVISQHQQCASSFLFYKGSFLIQPMNQLKPFKPIKNKTKQQNNQIFSALSWRGLAESIHGYYICDWQLNIRIYTCHSYAKCRIVNIGVATIFIYRCGIFFFRIYKILYTWKKNFYLIPFVIYLTYLIWCQFRCYNFHKIQLLETN